MRARIIHDLMLGLVCLLAAVLAATAPMPGLAATDPSAEQAPAAWGERFYRPTVYPHVELSKPLPRTVAEGTVMRIAGRAKAGRHERVNVFFIDQKTGEQTLFNRPMKGRVFSVPVRFDKTGQVALGITFGNETVSQVVPIDVIRPPQVSGLPAMRVALPVKPDFSVSAEQKNLTVTWATAEDRVSRFTFHQPGGKENVLYVVDGMHHLTLPFDFFTPFKENAPISITLAQAVSPDGSLRRRASRWQAVSTTRRVLKRAYPDEQRDDVRVTEFEKMQNTLAPIVVSGRVDGPGVKLRSDSFVTRPDGQVMTVPTRIRGKRFTVRYKPESFGTHVAQITTEDGVILFSKGVYVYPEDVLPVLPWKRTVSRGTSKQSILSWINRIRESHNAPALWHAPALERFAQRYAERMAQEKFFSHVDPQGRTFMQRAVAAGLGGSLGENLGFGSTLKGALAGLENSPGHRKNLIRPDWTRVGIGLARNGKGEYYVVQVFGR